jgi:hypothetical protein
MKRLHDFARLPAPDRWLLVESMCLLAAIGLGLWLLPFKSLRRLVATISGEGDDAREVNSALVGRVVWAVTAASRRIPRTRCLARAMAVQAMLGRRGYAATLRIGVAMGEGRRLRAHAWLERRGEILIGGMAKLSDFSPMPALGRR